MTWYTAQVADCPTCGRKALAISRAGILRPHLTAASMATARVAAASREDCTPEWCSMSLAPLVSTKPPTEVE